MFHKPEKKYWFIYLLIVIAVLAILIWPHPSEAAGTANKTNIPPQPTFHVFVRHVELGPRGLHFNIVVAKSKTPGRWKHIRNWHVYVTKAENKKICVYVYESHTKRSFHKCARTSRQLAWKIKSAIDRDLAHYIDRTSKLNYKQSLGIAGATTMAIFGILLATLALA